MAASVTLRKPPGKPSVLIVNTAINISHRIVHPLESVESASLESPGISRISKALMSLLRASHSPTNSSYPASRPHLRILASGTLFITHTLSVVSYPEAGGVARAQSVQRTRGGHSANVLAVLAQFRATGASNGHVGFGGPGPRSVGDVQFCGPLAGSEEGALVTRELEVQGVGMRFCAVRDGKGVPVAWVVEAGERRAFDI